MIGSFLVTTCSAVCMISMFICYCEEEEQEEKIKRLWIILTINTDEFVTTPFTTDVYEFKTWQNAVLWTCVGLTSAAALFTLRYVRQAAHDYRLLLLCSFALVLAFAFMFTMKASDLALCKRSDLWFWVVLICLFVARTRAVSRRHCVCFYFLSVYTNVLDECIFTNHTARAQRHHARPVVVGRRRRQADQSVVGQSHRHWFGICHHVLCARCQFNYVRCGALGDSSTTTLSNNFVD